MSIGKDIYDIGKDINEARKEYMKTQAKDEYIKLMENQLDQAMSLLRSLEVRLQKYESDNTFRLDDSHLKILKMFKDSDTGKLVNNYLFPNFTDDDRIAFEELLHYGYLRIVSHNVYGQISYSIQSDKMVEVLKLLRTFNV